MKDLIMLGPIVLDVLAAPVPHDLPPGHTVLVEHAATAVGGNAAVAALCAARLNIAVGLAGMVRNDPAADLLLHRIAAGGVDTHRVRRTADQPTSTTLALCRAGGERTLLHHPGANNLACGADLELSATLSTRSPTLCLSGVDIMTTMRNGAALRLLQRARHARWRTALDTTFNPDPERGLSLLRSLAPHCDLLITSMGDMRHLLYSDDPRTVATEVRRLGAREALVKNGAGGCVHLDADNRGLAVAAPVVNAIDTTGAGDNFVGAFVGLWHLNTPTPVCARTAVACGSCSVTHLGGEPAYAPQHALELADRSTVIDF